MAGGEGKNFNNADEVNDNFNNAKIEAVKVGNQRVMKLTLQPGWQWSKDIKPTVGFISFDHCQPGCKVSFINLWFPTLTASILALLKLSFTSSALSKLFTSIPAIFPPCY